MKYHFSLVLLIVFGAVLIVNYLVFAVFNEPTQSPPDGNVAAPINTSVVSQKKEGNLEVGSLTLGGVTRSIWPEGGSGGASCTWEGTKCDCESDEGTWASVRLIVSTTCTNGKITDAGIHDMTVSYKQKPCPPLVTPPNGCDLYTKVNKDVD